MNKARIIQTALLLMLSLGINAADKGQGFFKTREVDVGTVASIQESVTAQFRFSNHTKKPVAITKVIPSCGCMDVEFSKKPVRPGESGSITVSIRLSDRPGHFGKSVLVYTTGLPPVTLKVKGQK